MERELRITGDGSHTVFVKELNEPYHSVHGAIRESEHVFLKHGFRTVHKSQLRILETGFGTGLNAVLTLVESRRLNKDVYYHTVEKYPLDRHEYLKINHEGLIREAGKGTLLRMHEAEWGKTIRLSPHFSLFKERSDFREMKPEGPFDLIYFDAFDPGKQPHLWTEEIFSRISDLSVPGAVLVTYSAKGSVRRALAASGFNVGKVQGPPGKREMIRAVRI
jgi:tRNA U34 5-methylaminomethyl-2-thiouridine-forming methyltransferase MnmC